MKKTTSNSIKRNLTMTLSLMMTATMLASCGSGYDGSESRKSGFGHLVGMSQYGANAMAEKGSDYKAILTHYFTDTKLQKSTELAQLQ